MNVLRASAFNISSPVGSLTSSMPQRASTKRAPIPIQVKRFLVRHRPARMRAQRAKGKAKFIFHSKRQYLVHSLPRQLATVDSICFHCCDGRSPLLPINLFVGFHRKGAKSLHAIASSFFARSFAHLRNRVFVAQRSHTAENLLDLLFLQ